MSLTLEDIKVLSRPFDEKTIGVKVQSFNKERTKAMLVLYLQHTDVYARLEEIDPMWSMEIKDVREVKDERDGYITYVRCLLSVSGTHRENVGDGADYKSAVSDAIKRTAMLFGVGRYLYDSELVWVDYNEQRDKYREYTYQDYKAACRKTPRQETRPGTTPQAPVAPKPSLKSNVVDTGFTDPPAGLFDRYKGLTTETPRMQVLKAANEANWGMPDVAEEVRVRGFNKVDEMPENQVNELKLFIKGNPKKKGEQNAATGANH